MSWILPSVILAVSTLCSGAILENVADLNALNLTFDFIVVGGGTAGNVVANRLSENPNHKILVLEAGGSNADVLDIIVPSFCREATPNTAQDWNYTTTPQAGLNGRSIAYNRGFVLGGSSSVNYMVYTRGSKEDFNRWAAVTEDDGWSWDNLLPYMKKNEIWSPPADNHNTAGQFDPAVHGFEGITAVSLSGFPTPIDSRIIAATSELEGYPFNLDMNSGNPIGVGWGQLTVKDGERSSSATSYLASQFLGRPNLYVLLNARVTRVLETGICSGSQWYECYRFSSRCSDVLLGESLTLTATKEVILSAGSIGTPNILLHSGIGNSSTLTTLGIQPVHNLPSVGQNLSDHTLLFLSFLVNSTNTFETAAHNATLAAEDRTGPLVDNPLSHIGWLRVPNNSHVFEQFGDPSAGPNTPHFELIIANGMIPPPPPEGNFLSVVPVVVSPASRGSVTLNTNNLLADPPINPNHLGSEVDVFIMREAVKSAVRFTTAPAWDNYVLSAVGLNATTDAEIDAFVRANAATIYHPVGTASMSPRGAAWGVVDPDLRVKGLNGLRVVDLSVVPFIPAAHTQAAAVGPKT
ncbi:aryl-alcohol oxidase [Mycena olivaceomarginata]|nr:aryl-alcohol oxidase [Mycena olivaceomarginata]